MSSLRDGIIIVSIVLLLFLMNWRTAVIPLAQFLSLFFLVNAS